MKEIIEIDEKLELHDLLFSKLTEKGKERLIILMDKYPELVKEYSKIILY